MLLAVLCAFLCVSVLAFFSTHVGMNDEKCQTSKLLRALP